MHALWTLDGLEAVDTPLLAEKLKDSDGRVRAAAIRIAEPLIRKNDPPVSIGGRLHALAADPDPNVVIQYCMSFFYLNPPGAMDQVKSAVAAHPKNTVIAEVVKTYVDGIDKAQLEAGLGRTLMQKDPKLAAVWLKGRELYLQTCIACHGIDGKGMQVPGAAEGITLGPSLKGSVPPRSGRQGIDMPHRPARPGWTQRRQQALPRRNGRLQMGRRRMARQRHHLRPQRLRQPRPRHHRRRPETGPRTKTDRAATSPITLR